MTAPVSPSDRALDQRIAETALAIWTRQIMEGTTISERDRARREYSLWRQAREEIEAGA